MNVLTWNCCAGFGKKAPLLNVFDWSLAVIQECSQADAASFADAQGVAHVWGGGSKKGVAVFVRSGTVSVDECYADELAVILLAELGLASVYHSLRGEPQGGETLPTYYY